MKQSLNQIASGCHDQSLIFNYRNASLAMTGTPGFNVSLYYDHN